MNPRFLQLFRAWIPSWRFFETLSEQPVLYYRTSAHAAGELGAWRVGLRRPPRRWDALFQNAEGNLHLACYALLDQLEDDIQTAGARGPEALAAVPASPSYRLVENLVRFLLRERNELPGGGRFQFKVCRLPADGAAGAEAPEDIVVSPVHRI
ncbi:MAG: hypothetical protein KIS92_26105 [Planctomycetota bacterium]|nr:hypothetical protein [Planctomycetota bacterium]